MIKIVFFKTILYNVESMDLKYITDDNYNN